MSLVYPYSPGALCEWNDAGTAQQGAQNGQVGFRAYDRTAGRQVSRIFIGGKRDARKALDHLAASELNAAGFDLATAAAQLGHSRAVMAQTYLHSTDERGAKAGALIGGLVTRALVTPR